MMRRAASTVLMSLILLVPAGAAPPPAVAGSYDVHACDSSWSSPANNSFAAVADNGMVAFSECPAGRGMTVRNVYDNGGTGAFQGAYLIFDAPSGTYVDSMSYDAGVQRHNCVYSAAIVASNLDLLGRVAWGLAGGRDCESWQTPGDTAFFPNRWSIGIGAPRARLEVRCGAASCPRNGVTALRLRNVVVRVADNYGPALSGGRGSLWTTDGWLSGAQTVGFDANDGSGIRETSIQIDGREIAHTNNPCDYTRRAPCPQASVNEPFSTAGFGADGDHTLTLVAYDAAGNPSSASRVVHVDNSPPDPPKDLTLDGVGGWRTANAFDVRWTNPTPSGGAAVAAAEWQICREGSDKDCVRGSKGGSDLTSVTGLTVPGPGTWTLRVWLRDEAGNQEARLAAPPVTLRYDETSPDVSLTPLSADDPTRVVAPASDQGSGIAGGEIEIRKSGSTTWKPLKTTLEGSDLTARIDDEHLSDGTYELQARAADSAGNERVTTTFANGQPAQLNLPLRLKTTLTAGVARRSRGHVRLLRAAYASYGSLVQVRGRLATPEGNAMQGVDVQAYTQVRDGASLPRLIATVKTSKTGRFSFLVRRGPSRTIRIRYGGAAQIRSATRRVVLYVRSATTMRPSRHRLVNGETVRFSGRVSTGRIPTKGKLVELEVLVRGRWRTFATTRGGAPRTVGIRLSLRWDPRVAAVPIPRKDPTGERLPLRCRWVEGDPCARPRCLMKNSVRPFERKNRAEEPAEPTELCERHCHLGLVRRTRWELVCGADPAAEQRGRQPDPCGCRPFE
ncbi:MAG: hypothetical protein JWM93_265 [Frankiales bacterium]|nr:hypothetical protein [Frankiales bacterium]